MSEKHPLTRIRGLVSDTREWPDIVPKDQEEGGITFQVAEADNIYDAPAFFNPVMVVNRDLAILFAKLYSIKMETDLRVFEPLAGIGVRAFRLAAKIPEAIQEVVISDYNEITTAIANYNTKQLGLEDKVFLFEREARSLALDLAEKRLSYHYVDLDPFGPPSPFIDMMWPLLTYRAMIAVTATDMQALCGVFPEACLRKYGGYPLNNHHCHETAARLLIALVVKSAARFEKGVEPIFTTSVDHYTKVFFRVRTSRGEANEGTKNIGFSYTCRSCHQIYYTDFTEEKPECCGEFDKAGPLWIGNLFNTEWCSEAIELLDELDLPSSRKLEKILREGTEHPDLRGFFQISELCKLMTIPQPSFDDIFDEIRSRGFRVVRSRFTDQALRTDMPGNELKEVLQELVGEQS